MEDPLSEFSEVDICVLTILLYKNDLSNKEVDMLSTMTDRCQGCSARGMNVSRGISLLEEKGLLERKLVKGQTRYHVYKEDINTEVINFLLDTN